MVLAHSREKLHYVAERREEDERERERIDEKAVVGRGDASIEMRSRMVTLQRTYPRDSITHSGLHR